jgi:hypothetical protein
MDVVNDVIFEQPKTDEDTDNDETSTNKTPKQTKETETEQEAPSKKSRSKKNKRSRRCSSEDPWWVKYIMEEQERQAIEAAKYAADVTSASAAGQVQFIQYPVPVPVPIHVPVEIKAPMHSAHHVHTTAATVSTPAPIRRKSARQRICMQTQIPYEQYIEDLRNGRDYNEQNKYRTPQTYEPFDDEPEMRTSSGSGFFGGDDVSLLIFLLLVLFGIFMLSMCMRRRTLY